MTKSYLFCFDDLELLKEDFRHNFVHSFFLNEIFSVLVQQSELSFNVSYAIEDDFLHKFAFV